MANIGRRGFVKGATLGALAFTVGGAEVIMAAGESLLQARIFNFRPPFAEFYRTAITTVDDASRKIHGRKFVELSAADQRAFVDLMRQNKIEGWTGRPAAMVYAVLRADAVDVVYGTMEGYEALGIPYMPHIPPEKRW
jgi:hypothetical protein